MQTPWYKSRTFWTLIADFVFAMATLLVSLLWPQYSSLVLQIFGLLQPLVIALIAIFTVENTLKAYFVYKSKL